MELFCVFLFGMAAYPALEIFWRGYTHITMAFAGGICMTAVYLIALKPPAPNPFTAAAFGCAAITVTELLFGIVFNLCAGMAVWDYSSRPCNLLGQICLEYTALWYVLCLFLIPLCRFAHSLVLKMS